MKNEQNEDIHCTYICISGAPIIVDINY